MRALLMSLALALLMSIPAVAAEPNDEAIRKELQDLNGTWLIRSMTVGDKELRDAATGHPWVIKDGTMTDGKGGDMAAVLKISPTQSPRTIDILFTAGPTKGTTITGIYKREGEFLSICSAAEGKERPKSFTPGPGINLIVYQRQDGGAATKKSTPAPRSKTQTAWEYKTLDGSELLDLGGKNLNAGLNQLGEDGWELVAVEPLIFPTRPVPDRLHRNTTYYFKRPKAAVAATPAAPKPAAPRAEVKEDEIQILILKNVEVMATAKTLQQLFMDRKEVRIVADANTNTLLIRSSPEQFDLIRKLVTVLDSPDHAAPKTAP